MSGSSRRQVIKVWDYQRAPKNIKRVADDPAAAWVALIPATLAGADIEALFLRWSSDAHPVASPYSRGWFHRVLRHISDDGNDEQSSQPTVISRIHFPFRHESIAEGLTAVQLDSFRRSPDSFCL
jgi:hypothetical protein